MDKLIKVLRIAHRGRARLPGALLIIGMASAAAAEGPVDTPDFGALDRDGDGRLTLQEWRASAAASSMDEAVARAHFRLFDVDENGSVTEEEFRQVSEQVNRALTPEAI